ncbi:hypothetical protein CPC08DRAFT_815258 [Agrocybe pediades]|nr:hypothetical protein CPC08DRAFT_815258 [Agrocybe pediades]
MPVVELATWVLSDACLKDKTLLNPAIDFFKAGAAGVKSVHYGIAEEDQKTMYLFVVWESLEHHKALMARPDYPKCIGLGPTIGEGGLKMRHIEYLYDFMPALTAPVTEVFLMKLKDGKTMKDVDAVFQPLGDAIDKFNVNNYPSNRGKVIEDPKQYCITIGWDSVKAHTDCVGQESFKPFIEGIYNLADEMNLIHVPLKAL